MEPKADESKEEVDAIISQSMPNSNANMNEDEVIINKCAVLIIPLDNRVTPQMVASKFIKYGKILQVRPIKGSSTCIVIFSKATEASNCIALFESHDKVRVTRPDQRDWNQCTDPIPISNEHSHDALSHQEEFAENAVINEKIANYE